MRSFWWLPLAALLSACGSAAPRPNNDAGAPPRWDAGTSAGRDASSAGGLDAAVIVAGADAGVSLPDGGPLGCQLEAATAVIKLSGFQQENELADLTARDGKLGFAYSWNQLERRLYVADAATGVKAFDGVIAAISGSAIPRAMDLAAGLFFVAGNFDATAQTPFIRFAYLDTAGAASGDGTANDFIAMAAAREKAGARVLALGKLVGTDQPVYVNRYDLTGALTDSFEVGRDARVRNEWDLDWAYDADKGLACGVSVTADSELLALFELSGATSTPHATAVKLTAASASATSSFGCRIALRGEGAVVALAEGDGGARLYWLSAQGDIQAGPVPFATTRTALTYDVATTGNVTALAFLDDSSGVSHVVVRVFPSPSETPIELSAEADLNLGGFDLTGRRVRLAAVPGGFAVAFDAVIKTGQTDLYVRRVLCE